VLKLGIQISLMIIAAIVLNAAILNMSEQLSYTVDVCGTLCVRACVCVCVFVCRNKTV